MAALEGVGVSGEWNPYYLAYAAGHGLTPERRRQADIEAYPAGMNVPFMEWMGARWAEFRAAGGWSERVPNVTLQQPFRVWLIERYIAQGVQLEMAVTA